MKVRVLVSLKTGVLDPAGKAVLHGLHSLGFGEVGDVRLGKSIDLEIEGTREQAEPRVKAMCEQLLANPVIENARIEFL